MSDDVIIVIDSDYSSAYKTKEALNSFYLRSVRVYEDIHAAKKYLKENPVLAVITECDILGSDGLEFTKWLRGDSNNPNYKVPVFMLTSNSSQETIKAARDAGVNDFLAKPFYPDQLKNMLVKSIRDPKNFIMTSSYKGPDRRGDSAGEVAIDRRNGE